eukprot:m.179864 g.179864  ORF g.179864 m.179864 type:complete len:137 (+) comp39232_c0_seq11:35-445(+)
MDSSSTSARDCHSCPLCSSHFRKVSSLFKHVNFSHASRHVFPSVAFLKAYDRRICSSCGFMYLRRWSTCRRSQGSKLPRCKARMVDPGASTFLCHSATTPNVSSTLLTFQMPLLLICRLFKPLNLPFLRVLYRLKN